MTSKWLTSLELEGLEMLSWRGQWAKMLTNLEELDQDIASTWSRSKPQNFLGIQLVQQVGVPWGYTSTKYESLGLRVDEQAQGWKLFGGWVHVSLTCVGSPLGVSTALKSPLLAPHMPTHIYPSVGG